MAPEQDYYDALGLARRGRALRAAAPRRRRALRAAAPRRPARRCSGARPVDGRSADDVAIKKAFRRLALKHHPDADGSPEGAREFARICEAYDVLSCARTKGAYDLYGEAALKASADGGGCGYTFDAAAGPGATFARFFGMSNPFEALNSLAAHFERLTTQAKPAPGKQLELDLPVPLEEIHAGCVKVVSHTRSVPGEGGAPAAQQRSLTVAVEPGLPDGTRYVFEGEGDAEPGGAPPGAVVVVLGSAPHPVFRRGVGADLVARVQLPLLQALAGGAVSITTLDGRVLRVPLEEVVTPGLSMRVAGEGMPIPGGGGARGDLVLEFELRFPATLSQQQKALLRAALLLPARVSAAQAKALRAFEAAFTHPATGWSAGVLKGAAGEEGE
ncbi:DNAJB13 [Scenedesmus sp. PABB004]|nr:DNAJB13 [Scenedesmus sp. PABB004]